MTPTPDKESREQLDGWASHHSLELYTKSHELGRWDGNYLAVYHEKKWPEDVAVKLLPLEQYAEIVEVLTDVAGTLRDTHYDPTARRLYTLLSALQGGK